jgi:formylglycine-generating enzyme required for sulfatase activity
MRRPWRVWIAIGGLLAGGCETSASEQSPEAGGGASADTGASDDAGDGGACATCEDAADATVSPPIPAAPPPGSQCTAAQTQCAGNVIETCSNGYWTRQAYCLNQTCADGGCQGVCAPGQQQCTNGNLQSCDDQGQWGASWPCTTGACNPGSCAGATTTATSCASAGDGLSNCGTAQESCCTSLEVAGGNFFRGYNNSGSSVILSDPATVSGFRLDKYDVTVGRFRQFVNAVYPGDAGAGDGGPGWVPSPGSGKHVHLNGGMGLAASTSAGTTPTAFEPGWVASFDAQLAPTTVNLRCPPDHATWTPSPGTQETLPINCVTWSEAYAFCIWDGGFLPSETELIYAAAGGGEQREFPWGPPTAADRDAGAAYFTQRAIFGCNYPDRPDASQCEVGVGSIAPVGSVPLGAGLWGQLDLGGELEQWSLDSYTVFSSSCTDCASVASSPNRPVHGGSFDSNLYLLTPSTRNQFGVNQRYMEAGFRCARVP